MGVSRLSELRGLIAKIFASREWVAKASGWTHDWGFATGESPIESRKTMTLVFQYRTCLNSEKQIKY